MTQTLSPRQKLLINDGEEYTRVADLNANFATLDANCPTTVCTSVTRPATPFQGQVIYETDTGLSYIWTGAAWVYYAGGLWKYDAATSGASFSSGTLGITGNVVVPAVGVQRVLRAEFAGVLTSYTSGQVDFKLRKDGVEVRTARVSAANISGAGSYSEVLAAGASNSWQLVATCTAAVVVSSDPKYTYLTISLHG